LQIVPKVVIEVDTQADLDLFGDKFDYIQLKTEKLLGCGTEKVFWILSENQIIIEAIPDASWQLHKWNTEIQPIPDFSFTLSELLKNTNIEL